MPRFSLLPYRSYRRRTRTMHLVLPFLVTLLLLAPLYIIYKPPHLLIRYFQHRWPDVLFHVPLPPSAGKVVALTIDDAPSAHTAEIAAVLKDNDARATFFCIGGQMEGGKEVLAGLVDGGHELGNHAMRDEPSKDLADAELERQIGQVGAWIDAAYERSSSKGTDIRLHQPGGRYFRPGSGFFSQRMRALVDKLGYRVVLGNVYPHDAQVRVPWLNARHILSMVRPGSIIVCHDRRPWTAPMLRKMLPELKRRGYRVVTVTELLEAGRGL